MPLIAILRAVAFYYFFRNFQMSLLTINFDQLNDLEKE